MNQKNDRPGNEALDDLDRAILNEIQVHFPIVSRPYAEVGERLGVTEAEVMARVQRLHDQRIIRRIGANFNSRKLGYTSTLCTAEVPEEQMEQFVQVVNRYAGVTHNYLRRHRYNIWFTVIAPSTEKIEQILAEISSQTGIKEIYSLPARQIFKIQADFPL